MRRKDREMDREFGLKVIDKSICGVLSTMDHGNVPYGIPLSIVRDGDTLYFHSAKNGKKVNIFEKSPKVSVVFVGETKIPEIYTNEELDKIIKDESKAGVLGSKVFTTEFESAIVVGQVKLIEDEDKTFVGCGTLHNNVFLQECERKSWRSIPDLLREV